MEDGIKLGMKTWNDQLHGSPKPVLAGGDLLAHFAPVGAKTIE